MEDFKGNSNVGKRQEEKRVQAPVTTNTKVKNSLFRKFFAQDIRSAGASVTNDVLIPGVKGLIVNLLKKSVDYLFLGSSAPTNGGYTNYSNPFGYAVPRNVTYTNYSQQQNNNGVPVAPQRASVYMVNDIIFNDRGEAEETLSRMIEIVQMYGMASVQDFYDLIDRKGNNYTDNKYGWKDLSSAIVERCYEGYRIRFPKIIPIE